MGEGGKNPPPPNVTSISHGKAKHQLKHKLGHASVADPGTFPGNRAAVLNAESSSSCTALCLLSTFVMKNEPPVIQSTAAFPVIYGELCSNKVFPLNQTRGRGGGEGGGGEDCKLAVRLETDVNSVHIERPCDVFCQGPCIACCREGPVLARTQPRFQSYTCESQGLSL